MSSTSRTVMAALLLTAVSAPGGLVVLSRPLLAQSLADAARKEEERRQTAKPAAKVLTNKDLPNVPPPSSVVASPAGGDATTPADGGTAASDAKGDGKSAGSTSNSDAQGTKDEKYWSGRMKQLREQVQRDRMLVDALQSRVNALTTDFVNRDDPAQRAVIAGDRQKAVEELDRMKKSIVDGTKAISDLEEEARRAGAPAGWLR